jgi:hypothetical protein
MKTVSGKEISELGIGTYGTGGSVKDPNTRTLCLFSSGGELSGVSRWAHA